jgi:ribosomal protein S12 methylthiotransferase accessory factor
MITLQSCLKAYELDQDKAIRPEETVARVKDALGQYGASILAETRRIDTGRLGIPVFLSVCGEQARSIMPTRKQMGKGASPAQAEASALMELVERYSFFSRWADEELFLRATYTQAEKQAPAPLVPLQHILDSVGEDLSLEQARRLLDLVAWRFHPVTELGQSRELYAPMDWFKKLGEFNGSSAGNTNEESILQGGCELIERHVCCRIDRERPELPTIDPSSVADPTLKDLIARFTRNGLRVWLKDFSLDMPVPTVGALAYDPTTFPGLSEIVFTAGTSSSPSKAAIRALTEIAQLGGDFETGAVYEASGLPKFERLDQIEWLTRGELTPLDSLPDVSQPDIAQELSLLVDGLKREHGLAFYSMDITHPKLRIPAHYNFSPGLQFRERDTHASLGLFVGRILSEEAAPEQAEHGLEVIQQIYDDAHFLPFFRGMLFLRQGDCLQAAEFFQRAAPLQPDPDKQALSAFYCGYALTLLEDWNAALAPLSQALALCPEIKEYFNLRGVARYRLGQYEEAASDFSKALNIDRGSAMDLANLGACYKRMGQSEKARDFLQTALELDPSLDFARNHLLELE